MWDFNVALDVIQAVVIIISAILGAVWTFIQIRKHTRR